MDDVTSESLMFQHRHVNRQYTYKCRNGYGIMRKLDDQQKFPILSMAVIEWFRVLD